jgi:aminoacyl-tRNA hydrolase
VGLGNPGARFQKTPHNVGHRVLDRLARSEGGIWVAQAEGSVCSLDLNGIAVQLLKPGAAMNNNGTMVRRFVARSHGHPQNCIIVHDDMNFSLGSVRFKSKGGDAGHKGMRSVLSAFDSEDIPRIRIGVGLSADTRQAKRRVLTKFSASEEERLLPALEQAAAMVKEHIHNKFGG